MAKGTSHNPLKLLSNFQSLLKSKAESFWTFFWNIFFSIFRNDTPISQKMLQRQPIAKLWTENVCQTNWSGNWRKL